MHSYEYVLLTSKCAEKVKTLVSKIDLSPTSGVKRCAAETRNSPNKRIYLPACGRSYVPNYSNKAREFGLAVAFP